ncbi:hypothetical protein JNE110611_p1-30 (plasmid) [Escherichia coli]|nr:hypothetical protein JNE072951_p1-82 [Escherichia coli]BDQ79549.1 hypothetical protein JNE110611_p1-30 [Escherichia coli]BDQ84875.1 hypothetical protein PV0671_p2-28 [Escherichia coli]BDQ90337.1 hypothetical protein JNE071324_p1-78 [Escherichia coli]BDQ95759.1 hypothetical protein PV0197_p2-81 [Escherichia coli]
MKITDHKLPEGIALTFRVPEGNIKHPLILLCHGFCGIRNVLLLNRPGFPGECFICELRLPDHRFRWKHNKLFLLLPEEYGPAFPAIVDCYTSPPT